MKPIYHALCKVQWDRGGVTESEMEKKSQSKKLKIEMK